MTRFQRLTPDGSGVLEDWGSMPADDLIAGSGQQHGHLWLDDTASGLMVGLWACSPMTGRMGPWSTNEFIVLLEGSVNVDHADGSSLAATAGDAFFIPKGTVCSWRQRGDLKKYFVIHDDRSGRVPPDPATLRAQKIGDAEPFAPAQGPDPALLLGPAPECREEVAFTDLTKQLSTGVWSATPYRRKAIASPRHEVMHILAGEVMLDDGTGQVEMFGPGATCFVPMGAMVGWSSTVPVRKIFASFTPS